MAETNIKAERALDQLVAELHARGRLRIWSLVITLFGDAIVPRGGKARLSVLQDVMARLGIENGALRTAMSRLAADGWVEREKSGRHSIYALAVSGRHAFDEATKRIYAAGAPEWDGRWTVAVAPSSEIGDCDVENLRATGFARSSGNTWIRIESDAVAALQEFPDNFLVLTSKAATKPVEPSKFWQLDGVEKAYAGLLDRFQTFGDALTDGEQLEPLDALVARTLLIHDWRRCVLHDPGLPADILPDDWIGERARMLTRSIYHQLLSASECWLDGAGFPAQRNPGSIANRF